MTEKCKNCEKVITEKDEIEYSEENCEIYCSPDCATNDYYVIMRSGPISFEEMKEIKRKSGEIKYPVPMEGDE